MADPHETAVEFADWQGAFPARVETDRLVLRRADPETAGVLDFYAVCAHDPDIEEVTRYLGWDPHDHPMESREFLAETAEEFADGQRAGYLLVPKEAGEVGGGTGLVVDWERRTGTLGLWLRKRFWGRGYSGERAAALLALAFEHLDLAVVTVATEAGNDRSRRAIEKYVDHFGGRHEGLFRNAVVGSDGPVDHHRFSVARAEYEAAVG